MTAADWRAVLAGFHPQALSGTLLRLVESQEQVATRALVGTLARQALLEDLLEATKPPARPGSEGLHYLLATPFRYPPLRHGSRFGGRFEPSLFYGALTVDTVLAEAAYYRFVFWFGMAMPPPAPVATQHTLFGADYATGHGANLAEAPFAAYRDLLVAPARYDATQALGAALRLAGIEAFEYESARAPGGVNVALFEPRALAGAAPRFQETWFCEVVAEAVRFRPARGQGVHEFPLARFSADGRLPLPAA